MQNKMCMILLVWAMGITGSTVCNSVRAEAYKAGQVPLIDIVVSEKASSPEKLAAAELKYYLSRLYSHCSFEVVHESLVKYPKYVIRLGTPKSTPDLLKHLDTKKLNGPESYIVTTSTVNGRETGLIIGADPVGVMYGVYGLLEKLGYGFYISMDTYPKPINESFNFGQWDMANHPLVRDRIVFNWHNFLSGCTGWDEKHWRLWIAQSQKMGYNTIMVHAYGNNPMFTFSFNGFEKPVGYVGTTKRGRDWGNQHVNDVRRLPGGEIFQTAEFGSDVALVPDDQRIKAKQKMMKKVFSFAEERGIRICFALDIDVESMLPQDMIGSLPEKDRFYNGMLWLPRPDTQNGHSFYKAQVEALFDLYPEIDQIALWRRVAAAEWGRLKSVEQLPVAWQNEYKAYVQRKPDAAKIPQAVCSFAMNKVVGAFRKALNEIGRPSVQIATGSWGHDWIPALVEFFPDEVTIMPLDSNYLRYRSGSFILRQDDFDVLLQAKGRILPIIWAHHDDGEYIGRPIHPHTDFQNTLSKLKAPGFCIIHWMTRPLDLYFQNHINQTWSNTKNEHYRETCFDMARHYFGKEHSELLGRYLFQWATDAPIFGRVTTDYFFYYYLEENIPDPQQAIQACRKRLQILKEADSSNMTQKQQQRLDYFLALENVLVSFCQVQELAYHPAIEAIRTNRFEEARLFLKKYDPVDTIRQFSHLSQMAGGDRGEEAMVISLGTRWITDYLAACQAAGLEEIRINFGPTSSEPLAQGPGVYTFHVDKDGKYWSVRGKRETNQLAVAHNADVSVNISDDISESIKEIVQTGIAIDSPAMLAISPIMDVQKKVAPGDYRLIIYASSGFGNEQCKVQFHIERCRPAQIRVNPTRSRFLRISCRGNNENQWNSIHEITLNALDRESLNRVTASAFEPGHPSVAAVDGKAGTRWAARGNQWLQVPLNPAVEFKELEISWFQRNIRTYQFDLQVSDDGQSWRKLEILPSNAATQEKIHELQNSCTSEVTVHVIEKEVHLENLSTIFLSVVPMEGTVTVYGLRLIPAGSK